MLKMAIISVISHNPAALAKFYEDLLSSAPTLQNHDYREYEPSGLRWAIDPKKIIEKTSGVSIDSRNILIQLVSDNLEIDFQHLKSTTQVLSEIKTAPWGDKYFFARDPEGNLLYVYQKYEVG